MHGKGTAEINVAQGADKVTYSVTLSHPGDKCLVGAKIKNESSVKVKLNDFAATAITPVEDINFNYIPLNTNTEILDVNGICDYRFVIEWDADSTNPNPGTAEFEITLDYEQYEDIPDIEPSHDHGEGKLYNAFFNANGGTVSQNAMQITQGKKYGTMPTPTRTEYTFLGWYTKLENGTLVTANDTVDVENDINLYAMWSWDGHDLSHIERVEPTCTEDGNIEHYRCLSCNKLFSDENAESEITTGVVLPALGHSITYVSSVEPTCEENGNIAHYRCTRCNKTFSDQEGENEITDVTLEATGHNLSLVPEVEAKCTTAGNNPYYTCSVCNNAFKDAGAAVATTVAAETISALGHDMSGYVQISAPTCTATGSERSTCQREGCNHTSTRSINALGHDWKLTSSKAATCTAAGSKSYKCQRSGCSSTKTDTIKALGHDYSGVSYATHSKCGNRALKCKRCGKCNICGYSW